MSVSGYTKAYFYINFLNNMVNKNKNDQTLKTQKLLFKNFLENQK